MLGQMSFRFRRRSFSWHRVLVVGLFLLSWLEPRGVRSSQQPHCPTPLSLCANSVVQVKRLNWYCNSPNAYFWGGGSHRNSKTCSYNDKITFEVTVSITDDIYDVDDIYSYIAVQDSSSQKILVGLEPTMLCGVLVGSDCRSAGEYKFSISFRLDSLYNPSGGAGASLPSNAVDFCPVLVISFSSQDDSGYNLGGLNIECPIWDSSLESLTVPARANSFTARDWLQEYAMLSGTLVSLLIFSGFVWHQARRVAVLGSCSDPCMFELDQYAAFACPSQEEVDDSLQPTVVPSNNPGQVRQSATLPFYHSAQIPCLPASPPRSPPASPVRSSYQGPMPPDSTENLTSSPSLQ